MLLFRDDFLDWQKNRNVMLAQRGAQQSSDAWETPFGPYEDATTNESAEAKYEQRAVAIGRGDISLQEQFVVDAQRASGEVRKSMYSLAPKLSTAGTLAVTGAPHYALAAGGVLALSGHSPMDTMNIASRLDTLEDSKMSLLKSAFAGVERHLKIMGQTIGQKMEQLDNRIASLSDAITLLGTQKEELEASEKTLSGRIENTGFFSDPIDFVTTRAEKMYRGVREGADRYLRIRANRNEFGLGRLERTLEKLKSMRERSQGTLKEYETTFAEDLKRPAIVEEEVAKYTGRSKTVIHQMIDAFVNDGDTAIFELIKTIESPNPSLGTRYTKAIKRLKGRLHSESAMWQAYRSKESNRRRSEAREKATGNLEIARKMEQLIVEDRILPGKTLRMSWDKSKAEIPVNFPTRLMVRSIKARDSIVATARTPWGMNNVIISLKTGIVTWHAGESAIKAPLGAVNMRNFAIGNERVSLKGSSSETTTQGESGDGSAEAATQGESGDGSAETTTQGESGDGSAETTTQGESGDGSAETATQSADDDLLLDAEGLMDFWDQNDWGNVEARESLLHEVRTFNENHFGEVDPSVDIFGEVINIQRGGDSRIDIIFLRMDSGQVFCDVILRPDGAPVEVGQNWSRSAGHEFSYEAYPEAT